jgi:hypothetical protein
VLFGKWSGTEVKIDGQELLIMKESDIIGGALLAWGAAPLGEVCRPMPSHSVKVTRTTSATHTQLRKQCCGHRHAAFQ